MKTLLTLMLPVFLAGTCFGQYAAGPASSGGTAAGQGRGVSAGRGGGSRSAPSGMRSGGGSMQGVHPPTVNGSSVYSGRQNPGFAYGNRVATGIYGNRAGTGYYKSGGVYYGGPLGRTYYGGGMTRSIYGGNSVGVYNSGYHYGGTNGRAYGNTRNLYGGGSHGDFHAVPSGVYSHWDHHHDYAWDHHRYHWSGNQWIIYDSGPYDYDYDGQIGAIDDESAMYDIAPDPSYSRRAVVEADANPDALAVDVQRALARAGYYRGPIDGVVGPGTREAITDYQHDQGLSPTGRINEAVVRNLGL